MNLENILNKTKTASLKVTGFARENAGLGYATAFLTAALTADRATTILCVEKFGHEIEKSDFWRPLFQTDFGLYYGASLV